MGEPDPPSLPTTQSKPASAFGLGRDKQPNKALPLTSPPDTSVHRLAPCAEHHHLNEKNDSKDYFSPNHNVGHSSNNTKADGETSAAIEQPKVPLMTRIMASFLRFLQHTKNALTHSWINLLLIFVPIGIVVKLVGLKPEIVFSMNAIAIIPLAGLLAFATEAVAAKVGDALGALLNVSFGNAVELILFIILLQSNQIEVVQASLLGSILANLLLILGMAFLLGGLRYQEQVYNSTVTQMSGVMLALAVMSLLLPTAFHAAFNDNAIADHETLAVSRGTSVILLLVYFLYLLFQLKSHRYLYASTPQHIIDEESHPGVLAGAFDSSSSDSSSSGSSDSDGSSNSSSNKVKRKARRVVKRLRRKSSVSSKDGTSASALSSPSADHHESPFETVRNASIASSSVNAAPVTSRRHSFDIMSGDEADVDRHLPVIHDFEVASHTPRPKHSKREKREKRERGDKDEDGDKEKKKCPTKKDRRDRNKELEERERKEKAAVTAKPKITFAEQTELNMIAPTNSYRVYRPALPSLLSNNVFSNPQSFTPGGPAFNIRIAAPRDPLRRTKSLPEQMNRPPSQVAVPTNTQVPATPEKDEDDDAAEMSVKAAIFMLLISTGLVAVCADFMSDAIEPLVETSGVSQAFIGLIILPIVGNAAEHVTAVAMAMKNKVDLAIGVAIGSSIQIAIFITPLIVLLGWMMGKPMTLYFNIFETVALFVTVLVVNFLVLDGRSNYLEGSLLIAAYIIIALASFFYPDGCDASAIGGNEQRCGNGNSMAQVIHMVRRTMW